MIIKHKTTMFIAIQYFYYAIIKTRKNMNANTCKLFYLFNH